MIQGKLDHRDVTYVVEQIGACAWYRCRTPGMALADAGYRTDLVNKLSAESMDASSVIVWQRPSLPRSLSDIRVANTLGITTVVEMDDDLWNIAHDNPAWIRWNGPSAGNLRILEDCVRAAKIVTCTTPALAQSLRFLNRNVHILPNMLPDSEWPRIKERRVKAPVVGWAGSMTHGADLRLLSGVIETLVNRYPHLTVEIAGCASPFAKHERIVQVPPVQTTDYPALLRRFDIGLAPVTQTRFNAAKSDLKFLEYAACSVPTVVSAGPTYASVEHGVTGYRAKNAAEWLRYIDILVRDAEKRHAMGDAARVYAESRFASVNVGLWEKAYGLGGKR